MKKNSNSNKIHTAFRDGRFNKFNTFTTFDAASVISGSDNINIRSIIAALEAIDELSRQGLVGVVKYEREGGYCPATWQVIDRTEA